MAGPGAAIPSTYRPPSPPQGRRGGRLLNTIMEDENEDHTSPIAQLSRRHNGPNMKIEAWLSPIKDHFPTPRGFHFMPAPNLPSSPSSNSADDSQSPSSSSNPSSSDDRWTSSRRSLSAMTDATEFDDLYDVSDEEVSRHELRRNGSSASLARKNSLRRKSTGGKLSLRLVIPGARIPADPAVAEAWSARSDRLKNKIASPVAPTPTSIVAMSPAVMSFMQAQQSLEVPTISAPPSLDGSLTSDQMAQLSAPATPVIGAEDSSSPDWSGVHLQPGALATLAALSGSGPASEAGDDNGFQVHHSESQLIEVAHEEMSEARRAPPRLITNIARASVPASPGPRSLAGLTRLEIPSPGGFFSGLSPNSRHTWNWTASAAAIAGATFAGAAPAPAEELAPPTSTTAEQFYRAPWNMDAAPPIPRPLPPQHYQQHQQHQQQPSRPLHMTAGDFSSSPIEQVVELPNKLDEDDLPTAVRIVGTPEPVTARLVPLPVSTSLPSGSSATLNESLPSPVEDIVATEILAAHQKQYAAKQQEVAISHHDRTARWLTAQRAYMKGVDFIGEDDDTETETEGEEEAAEESNRMKLQAIIEEMEVVEDEEEKEDRPPVPAKDVVMVVPAAPAKQQPEPVAEIHLSPSASCGPEPEAAVVLQRKKTVRFSELVKSPTAVPLSLPSKLARQESAYYRAFLDYTVRTQRADAFINRMPRFEALQAQRVSLRESHRNQLLGKYQLSVVPLSAKKRMSTNVVRGDDVVIEDPEKLRADRDCEALAQSSMAAWHVAATKMLNGGRLLAAPVHKRLARMSTMFNSPAAGGRVRPRILDLGGQTTSDWAWHASLQYPNAKVYTVTTKAIRQLSNCNVRGPPNHRQVAVQRLTRLPFADGQFDLVSARELQSVLKFVGENGEDEWESCLRECMRVLKPGGYLEFSIMDSDVINAGPLGNAKAVEFGFALKTLGYDPSPSRLFLGRLARAGFEQPRRAWMCLPMGPRPAHLTRRAPVARDSAGLPIPTLELEAMVTGSSDDAAALTGLVAGWSWERWLLRAEMEAVAGELRLSDTVTSGEALRQAGKSLEGVHAIVEEGRQVGSCWRVLRGYARKPRPDLGFIDMVLDTGFPLPPNATR